MNGYIETCPCCGKDTCEDMYTWACSDCFDKFREEFQQTKEHKSFDVSGGRKWFADRAQPKATYEIPKPTRQLIEQTCDEIKAMLISKNESYGDSALKPARIFSKSDSIEQLKVRIDDKLSRIMRGNAYGEDVVMDLIGYFILLRVAEKASKT